MTNHCKYRISRLRELREQLTQEPWNEELKERLAKMCRVHEYMEAYEEALAELMAT